LTDEIPEIKTSDDETILHQQFVRAVSSFEGIILSQIEMKNILAARLNHSIQAGLIILGLIAISILILLLTLSTQVNKISSIVNDMNTNFTLVSQQMNRIQGHIASMEKRVSLLGDIEQQTTVMDNEMSKIVEDMKTMTSTVNGISTNVNGVRNNVSNISVTMDRMDFEVNRMSYDIDRMSKPARRMDDMFPFP
jgi:uncharacterized protein YoxC